MINKTHPITENLLKHGLTLSLQLLNLLLKEAECLKNPSNAEIISQIAAKKKETVSKLDQFSKQLSQVLATENLPMTPSGISKYFNKAKAEKLNPINAIQNWEKIISASKQCHLLNEKNGASINLLAQHTHRSLQILKGKKQQPTTYGPDGSANSERFSQALASV